MLEYLMITVLFFCGSAAQMGPRPPSKTWH